ncbi:hypothetical protein RCL1_007224 [Eukaryota sp. TZLM3-RCL]
MRVAFLVDPLEQLGATDTSIALMKGFQERNWSVYFFTRAHLHLKTNIPYCRCRSISFYPTSGYQVGTAIEEVKLSTFDLVMIRTEPPVDQNYLHDLQVLRIAKRQGVFIINDPDAIIMCNEKLNVLEFPEYALPSVVSRDTTIIKQFYKENAPVVIKPLDEFGGSGVFLVNQNDTNVDVIIDLLSQNGQKLIVAQKYEPDVKTLGDTRIFLINGEPMHPVLQRLPVDNSIRSNIVAGGRGVFNEISEFQLEICKTIKNFLLESGLLLVGIDILGKSLNEINITCPCFPVAMAYNATRIDVLAVIVDKLIEIVVNRKAI